MKQEAETKSSNQKELHRIIENIIPPIIFRLMLIYANKKPLRILSATCIEIFVFVYKNFATVISN